MPVFQYGEEELAYLKSRDKKLGAAIDRIGRIEREVIPDLFAALVNSIVGQQISPKAAVTVWNRLQNRLGDITPQAVFAATDEEIRQCGLSSRKTGYIRSAADAVMKGKLHLEEFAALPDSEIITRLSALPGIGVWTAEMLLIFSMQRPDVVSYGDLAIRRGMMKVYGLESLTREDFEEYRQSYSPCGSVASLYLWAVSHEAEYCEI